MVDVASIAICLALAGLVVYVLSKLKLLTTVIVVFLAVVLLYLVMAFVPALQIEPVYSMLRGFFEGLPDMIGRAVDYVGRMVKGVGSWG
ncbi:MAG: hypothetical protein QXR17_07750 [Candidatus Bathyarchaeia archaeon]